MTNNKGLMDWNKLVKPSARDFKPYRKANNWVDYKEVFMITLEAQNLTHLVDPSYVVVDEDLHQAQQKFLYKVFKDNMLHHEAKSIVKFHAKTKDTALIWQKTCKTYDESMSTSLNGDAILGWLTSSRLDDGKWNRSQGAYITFCVDKIDKFNEMCPDSEINDMQGVRMLQNSIANVPNQANVLILYRQTKTSAGLPDKITLRQFVSLLVQQAQVYDNGRIFSGRNYRWSAANHELDYEINAHYFDKDEEEDLNPDEWFEANVINQCNPKTGGYLGNRNGNKSTGFKKTQNYKCQANQMQGARSTSRAFMDRETWNALEDSDKKVRDQLSEPAKTKITAYHFNKGKEHAAQGSEVNQMEAKEHDLIFDDSDEELEAKQHDLILDDPEEEEEATVEVNNFETVQVSNAESTRKMYEDKGVDFDVILQAHQANTRIQVRTHELLDSDSSDEESVADLEVNMHNLRPKIQGLMEFSDSDDEDEDALDHHSTMEEVLAIDARDKIDDPDTSEEQSIEQKNTAKMFKGMLHFSDSEDEDEDQFQLQTCGFTSSIEEAVTTDGKDVVKDTGNEGIIGEQEGNPSSLTDSNTDWRRLIDEFHAHDGLMHFSDSEDKAEEKVAVGPNKEETKVMTGSEYEKASIAPPPASKTPYPKNRRTRSLSPKPTSLKTTKTTSPPQTP